MSDHYRGASGVLNVNGVTWRSCMFRIYEMQYTVSVDAFSNPSEPERVQPMQRADHYGRRNVEWLRRRKGARRDER